MEINNPQIFDHIKEDNGNTMKCKMIAIGDWDMNAVHLKEVTHGLTWSNIRDIRCWVRNDADNLLCDLQGDQALVGKADGIINLDQSGYPGSVVLQNTIGGYFNTINFDSTSYNRGWVFIWYVE